MPAEGGCQEEIAENKLRFASRRPPQTMPGRTRLANPCLGARFAGRQARSPWHRQAWTAARWPGGTGTGGQLRAAPDWKWMNWKVKGWYRKVWRSAARQL